jgi:thiol-disulfide isomerase/thioredoxin
MASESDGSEVGKEAGHRNHFEQLAREGKSWSGREPNTLFQNRGDGTFDEVGNLLGVASKLDSRGVAHADLDGDGDSELLVYNRNAPTLRIYRNDAPAQGRVLQLELRPSPDEPVAVGAQVVARCEERAQLRQVEAGGGFLAQSSPVLHFGFGDCEGPVDLEVRWPSGRSETLAGQPLDHRVTLVAGTAGTVGDDAPEPVALRARNADAGTVAAATSRLSAPAPPLSLTDLDGGAWDLADAAPDETIVLNFWATWCIPCRTELPELQALHERYAGEGVRFVGVVMDEEADAETIRAFLADFDVDYAQVWGGPDDQAPFATLAPAAVGAIPITAVVRDGLVREVVPGVIDMETMADLLEALARDEPRASSLGSGSAY